MSATTHQDYLETTIKDEVVWLLPEKAIYLPRYQVCVIADLHIGKLSTFRKAGIGIPLEGENENWQQLTYLLLNYPIKTCVFLGDLIHSDYNAECNTLEEILVQFPDVKFILTEGNHDVHSKYHLERIDQLVIVAEYVLGPFLFTHIPLESPEVGRYNVAGHIHPAVRLRGRGRDRMKLPCFFVSSSQMLLPAFGNFTGSKSLNPHKDDRIFACTGNKVIQVQ